ncbi:MAG: hypothetical protein ABI690_15045 [Chloroflexota bacterium]
MTEESVRDIVVEESWVNVTEGAKFIGYHRMTVFKLAQTNWNQSEDEREIRVRRLSNGYLLWLPDLIKHSEKKGRQPQPKRKHLNT